MRRRRDTTAAGLIAEFDNGDDYGLARGIASGLVMVLWAAGIIAVFWLLGFTGM